MSYHTHSTSQPLVSVVIPCYNHALYLPKAIGSVLKQTYSNIEIVVVDDGSVDKTEEVAKRYSGVRYIYQPNQGLSAARNTGAKNSKGEYIMFLDADDWLYPEGIATNVGHLLINKEVAFVSGTFDAVYIGENALREGKIIVESKHYNWLLHCNYIGMIATVLFHHWVFKEFSFDTALRNCEDYDLYLKIARKYTVYHHLSKIAAYRIHASNMSSNIPAMLAGSLHVLEKQKNNLLTEDESKAYKNGKRTWKRYYSKELYKDLKLNARTASKDELLTLARNRPHFLVKYIIHLASTRMKSVIKKVAPAFSLRILNKLGLYRRFVPRVGEADLGDFNRKDPFSKTFGYDRGGPIDRYYIENFLCKESGSIEGRVLEIGDNSYTLQYGGDKIKQSDILHVDGSNPDATIMGDISNAPHIPDNSFDCIILTQTLHLIYDFKGALDTCYRILKPRGTLLLTVPGITSIDHGEWQPIWYWSFTDKAMKKLFDESFPAGHKSVRSYGNVLAASAFLYGMGVTELTKEKLDHNDPHYQVIITVKAQKA